jgi:hypothetical protein
MERFGRGLEVGQSFQARNLEMEMARQQMREEQTMSDLAQRYMKTSNPGIISQIAARNPQRAQGLINIQTQVMQNQARGVKSFANTFNNTPESQRSELYPELIKRARASGIDTSEMPLEYNKDTAQQINDVIRSESQKADQFLSRDVEYGKIPEGYYLEKETRRLRPMEGFRPGVSEKPPSGYQWTPQGTLVAISGGPATKVSAEQAGKIALVKSGQKDVKNIRDELFTKEGKLNRRKVAALKTEIPFTDFAPARIGKLQDVYSRLYNAVEAKLRLESGAAVPETEVRRAVQRFIPNIQDSTESANAKLDRLDDFLGTALQEFQKGRITQKAQDLTSMSTEELLEGF